MKMVHHAEAITRHFKLLRFIVRLAYFSILLASPSALPLLLAFAFAIGEFQENQEGLGLNVLNQVHVHSDDVNLLGWNINIIKNIS